MPLGLQDLLGKTAAERRALKLAHFIDDLPARLPVQWTYAHPARGNIGVKVFGVGYRGDILRLDVEAQLVVNGKKLAVASPMFILNPPMMARTGRKVTNADGILVENFEWNPLKALREDVEHTVGLMPALRDGEVVDDADPTLTVYPDAGDPGSTTTDGYSRYYIADPGDTWANVRDRTSTSGIASYPVTASGQFAYIYTSNTTNQFRAMGRGTYLFDTSSIASGDTITSATLSIYGSAKGSVQGSPDLDIVTSNPASNTTLADTDYNYTRFGTSPFASISMASFSTSGYNDFSVGGSAVTKAGITKLGARISWDTDNSYGGTWTSVNITGYTGYFADQAGTSNDPKLVVVYTAATTTIVNPLSVMRSRIR